MLAAAVNAEGDAVPGQDPVSDVVCNMVGILLVLVMIVGVRASRPAEFDAAMTPKKLRSSAGVEKREESQGREERVVDATALTQEINEALAAKKELERDTERMVDLAVQAAATEARREQLLMLQSAVEQQIAERRAKLDEAGKTQFDVQRAIAEAEIKLSELTKEQISLVSQTVDVEEVECVPTPLAKTVEGDEIHVRIKRGMLAVVPSEALLEEVRARGGDDISSGLRDRS